MLTNLAEALHHANIISGSDKHQIIQLSNQNERSILDNIIELDIMTAQELTEVTASLFNMAVVDINNYDYEALINTLPLRALIIKHFALPLFQTEQTLTVAIVDPTNLSTEGDFCFTTGLQIETLLADYHDIYSAIQKAFGKPEPNHKQETTQDQALNRILNEGIDQDLSPNIEESDKNDAPVSQFIHQVITDAIARSASDIHFEPYENLYRIRMRCDGILIEMKSPPPHLAQRFSSRIKVLAKLDITNRRLPQDGRIQFSTNENSPTIDIRVSTLPSLWGEKIVLRILDNRASTFAIDTLGYNDDQKQLFLSALNRPQGMILVTGPTGSGKTASLYTGLQIINTSEKNISTAEDPVEIAINGVNQVQIDNQIDFGFAQALRAFLRQDPDIIMLGEIRDEETASIAIRAAQTGHLVLSTLHTNSAAETIVRLINMGIEPFNITVSVSLIIAQRLVRQLCPNCRVPNTNTTSNIGSLKLPINTTIFDANPKGCIKCHNGFQGRIGVFEVLTMNQHIKDLIERKASTSEIEQAAIENGMLTLQNSALEKLRSGTTSYSELKRVLLL